MQYCRRKDVVARTVAGENLLVPVQGGSEKVFTLNQVGSWLWDCIETPRTAEDLAEALVEHYRIAREVADADVRIFLDDMVRLGLVD